MNADKPNFLSQPVVKNVFMYRNGDPYYEARRIVINQKRVCNFETLLREVTGGIQAPFGAVRNIYTPRGGHKVNQLDGLQSGEQYVAAGRERFKKLDYLEIGTRKKRLLQALPLQAKPPPQNRINVSARFLKPIKEPCPIFAVANGDVLNPAMRLLIHQRMLGQFDKILELLTEKMGLRVLGGVRSLYTYEGQQVTNGNQLESGQLYVAVGRDRFKKLPYIDLLFSKPRGMRKYDGIKAYSLPPIYRMSKQNGTGKSMVQSSDSGDSKGSPPALTGCNSKEHLSAIVREISQARLISLRKRRSGQSMAQGTSDQDDAEGKGAEADDLQNQTEEQNSSPNDEETAKERDSGPNDEETAKESDSGPNDEETAKESDPGPNDEETAKESDSGPNDEETAKESDSGQNDEETAKESDPGPDKEPSASEVDASKDETRSESTGAGEKQEAKGRETSPSGSAYNVDTDEKKSVEEGTSQGQSPRDKTQDSNEKQDGESSKGAQNDQDKSAEEVEERDSGKEANGSHDGGNDADTGEEQKEQKEDSDDPEKAQAHNESKEAKSSNANREEDGPGSNRDVENSGEVNGGVSGGEDKVKREAELDMDKKDPDTEKEKKEEDK